VAAQKIIRFTQSILFQGGLTSYCDCPRKAEYDFSFFLKSISVVCNLAGYCLRKWRASLVSFLAHSRVATLLLANTAGQLMFGIGFTAWPNSLRERNKFFFWRNSDQRWFVQNSECSSSPVIVQRMPSAHLKLHIHKLLLPSNSDHLSLPPVGQTATNEFDWLCFKKYWQAFWSEKSFKGFKF
jgi:hypothetical protein